MTKKYEGFGPIDAIERPDDELYEKKEYEKR